MVVPSGIRLAGPLAPYKAGLWEELLAKGYSPLTGANLLRLAAHLSRWMEAQGVELGSFDYERVDEFLQHRTEAGYKTPRSLRGVEPVLGHLRRMGAVPTPGQIPEAGAPLDILLRGYDGYLVHERALTAPTRQNYLRVARQFLSSTLDPFDVTRLAPADVSSFILRESRKLSIGFAKLKVTALRSLLRYLQICGYVTGELAAAVPAIAGWRLVGIPKFITPTEVEKLLRSCDRRTAVGRRDFSALLLMVRLGLRAGEVASLRLDDVDWHHGELVIRGKLGRKDRLPLPREVGEALASYLRRGRPHTTSRHLFLRAIAPLGGLSNVAVELIVQRAGRRIGLTRLGAHRLRHTAATQMLRNGASLSQIAQVLRHRHLNTTAIYAKVDRLRLRELCRPWPGGER